MPTFIKPGFWNIKRKQFAGELNLDKLIQENSSAPNYKIFSAIVTQTGAYSSLTKGPNFVIGQQYTVTSLAVGDNFTNIGFVSTNVPFTATGTTATTWIGNSLVINTPYSMLPQFTIVENTLGITLTPTYNNQTSFKLTSNSPVFLLYKTFCFPYGFINNSLSNGTKGVSRIDDSTLLLDLGGNLGSYKPYPIEIKVYD
jgi:hypothetical protein